jgi:hypothetical protein
MSHPRCTLALIAVLALGGAWFALRSASPNLNAAQPAKQEEKKAPQEPPTPSNRAFELAEALEKTVDFSGVDAPEVKLGEELERIQKVYKLTFDINEAAFKLSLGEEASNVLETLIAKPTPIPPMKTRLSTVIKRILGRVGGTSPATYMIRRDVIEITTERAARIELEMPPAKEGERPLFLLTAEFTKQPLQGVLDRLSDLSGRTVALDPRAQNKGETAITARLLNVPTETAVKLVADMAGLEVVKMDNVFYATTTENAARLRKEHEKAPAKPSPAHHAGPPKPKR